MSSMYIKDDIILDFSKVEAITVRDECILKRTYLYKISLISGTTITYSGTGLLTKYKEYVDKINIEKTTSEEK